MLAMNEALYRSEDADLRYLTLTWYRRARQAQLAHTDAADRARRRERLLGVPTVVLTTVVGSAAFATLGKSPRKGLQFAAGTLSILAAVLAALQTFLKLGDAARSHTESSRAFGSLRRDLGQLGADAERPRDELKRELERVRQRYDALSEKSPDVPPRLFERRRKQTKGYWPPEFSAWPEAPESPQ
jgi:hypothetical protein